MEPLSQLPAASASLEATTWLTEATPDDEPLVEGLLHGLHPPPDWYEIEGFTRPKPCGLWTWWNPDLRKSAPFKCGRWNCPVCSFTKAREWASLLDLAPIQRHVVITRIHGDHRDAARILRNIIKGIRRGEAVEPLRGRRRPRRFEYFASAEKHTRAGVHVHLLQHGDWIHQRLFGEMLQRYGAGRINWVERLAEPGKRVALARYVVRHLILFHHPFQPKVGRKVRYSRRFWDPEGRITPPALRRAFRGDPHEGWQLLRTEAYNGPPSLVSTQDP